MRLRCSNIKSAEISHFKKDVLSSCYRPLKIRYFNCVSETYDYMNVPCGRCVYCMSMHQQDWVTRMSLQSMTSKYTYFVTLTFSPDFLDYDKETADLLFTIKKDNKSLPLLLHKKPLQNFLKRLRFNLSFPIKFFGCGEYGDTFSRPHYHLIIWSDSPISLDDISKSWSLGGKSIGRIQFDNLRLNGTLDDLFRDSSSSLSGFDSSNPQAAFRYVAKYCTKIYKNINLSTIYLIKQIYEKEIKGKSFEKRFNISNCPNGSYQYKGFRDFIECFKPFVVCSTKSPIGIEYIEKYLHEWSHEVPHKIEMYGHVFQTPKFAKRCWKNHLYPYRAVSVINGRASCVANPLAILRGLFSSLGSLYIEHPDYVGGLNISRSPYNSFMLYDVIEKSYLYYDAYNQRVDRYKYDKRYSRSLVWYHDESTRDCYSRSVFPYTLVEVLEPIEFFKKYSERVVNYISYLRDLYKKIDDSDKKLGDEIDSFKQFNDLDDFQFTDLVSSFRLENEKLIENKIKSYLARKRAKKLKIYCHECD